jgi:hypothetical protein
MSYNKRPLPSLQFLNLLECSFLRHAIFMREGGYSKGVYYSLNLSFDVGDREQTVKKNLALVRQYFGAKRLIWSSQIHNKNVLIVKENTPFLDGFDAFITNITKIGLLVKLADCQGILLCDVKKKVIAAIHCGWRGNVYNIIATTIKAMKDEFKSSPNDILAGISPSLGLCCGEFKDYKKLLPKAFWCYRTKETYFDWWSISYDQLLAAGVPKEQIEIIPICTVCDKRFFSYRRNKGKTGRFGAIIMLI